MSCIWDIIQSISLSERLSELSLNRPVISKQHCDYLNLWLDISDVSIAVRQLGAHLSVKFCAKGKINRTPSINIPNISCIINPLQVVIFST